MKNAFLIPDPLIHNPLICNPQSPQGKKRKSTAALQYLSMTSGQVLQRELSHRAFLPPCTKCTSANSLPSMGGLRDNKNQTALVGVGEHWMFGEVLSIMFQELAQLPTDLCRISSFPAVLPLLRTFSKVPVTFLTGSAATAPQEGVLVPVKRLSWLHLGDVSPVPSSQQGTHGCRSSSSLPQQDQFSAHTPAQHTQA